MQVNEELSLDAIDPLKAEHFCDRREVGIINIGNEGTVIVDGESYGLNHKDAIYIGMGVRSIVLKTNNFSIMVNPLCSGNFKLYFCMGNGRRKP